MALVVKGLLNKQIAFEFGTAEKTIKVHRARVMAKMEADSLAELVRVAARVGIGENLIAHKIAAARSTTAGALSSVLS